MVILVGITLRYFIFTNHQQLFRTTCRQKHQFRKTQVILNLLQCCKQITCFHTVAKF